MCVYAQVSESCTLFQIAIIKDYVGQNVCKCTDSRLGKSCRSTHSAFKETHNWLVRRRRWLCRKKQTAIGFVCEQITSSFSRLTTFAAPKARTLAPFQTSNIVLSSMSIKRRGLLQMREMWVLTSRCPSHNELTVRIFATHCSFLLANHAEAGVGFFQWVL